MKLTMVHGQSHKGSTYHIGKILADKLAKKIRRNYGHVKPGIRTKLYFEVMRKLVKGDWNKADVAYWKEQGWTGKNRPWKEIP